MKNHAGKAFRLTRQKDIERVFARGTCDMKGFIAIALAKVPDMVAAKLKEPVYLAFSCHFC